MYEYFFGTRSESLEFHPFGPLLPRYQLPLAAERQLRILVWAMAAPAVVTLAATVLGLNAASVVLMSFLLPSTFAIPHFWLNRNRGQVEAAWAPRPGTVHLLLSGLLVAGFVTATLLLTTPLRLVPLAGLLALALLLVDVYKRIPGFNGKRQR